MDKDTRPYSFNKSAGRVMDILDYIAAQQRAVTVTEISRELRIPKSSAFNLLQTLMSRRYIEVEDGNLKTFKLGFRLFQTGVAYLQNIRLHQVAHPLIKALMEESGETVFLGAEDNGRMVFLDAAETSTSIRTTARLGRSHKPMYCSGLGKALLASYPEGKVREIISRDGFVGVTENTVKSFDELRKELERTRARGYALDNREGDPNLICVAAPIRNQMDEAIGSVSIATPFFKMDTDRQKAFGGLVARTALEISRALGFLGSELYGEADPKTHSEVRNEPHTGEQH